MFFPSQNRTNTLKEIGNHKKVLIVEGYDELLLCEEILKHLEINDVKIFDLGGKDKLKKSFSTFKKDPSFPELERIGFIRDADNNKAKSAFDSVCSVLNKYPELHLPKSLGVFSKQLPKIGVFVSPNNHDNGMLEDMCLKSVENDPSISLVDEFICAIDKNCNNKKYLKNKSKSKMLAYLAAQDANIYRLGIAAQKGYWDFNHSAFSELKRFLLKFK